MEGKAFDIVLEKNPVIAIRVIPGHFTTSSVHSNYYLNVGKLKSNARVARDVARELAIPYLSSTLVDTIVCMENTQVIGAYLAQELLQDGTSIVNSGGNINVLTPMSNVNGKLVFYESEVKLITNRNVLLLVATISTGRTIRSALECVEYYGGKLAGISTLFLATETTPDKEVNTLFTFRDIPGYKLARPENCVLCKDGQKLDAIISSEGYIMMNH